MNVAVLGSLNLDVVFHCEALPIPGQTLLCDDFATGPGGKGLNQAVAARRAGAETSLLGAVGADASGDALLSFLKREDILTHGVVTLADAPTGVAHIVVDRDGENSIIVASGANRAVPADRLATAGLQALVWLAQLEMDIEVVGGFLREGRQAGARTILNAAPAIEAARSLFGDADLIIVNEHELAQFSGVPCPAGNDAAIEQAARKLMVRDDQILIVTLGAKGTQLVDSRSSFHVAAAPVVAVDTTGAGDCFCGVLAASLAQGASVPDAVRRANIAAGIAVGRTGAAPAMPLKDEIEAVSNG